MTFAKTFANSGALSANMGGVTSLFAVQMLWGQASESFGDDRRFSVSKVTGPRSAGPNKAQIRSGPTIKNTAKTAIAAAATTTRTVDQKCMENPGLRRYRKP